jgi:hypothetical protein
MHLWEAINWNFNISVYFKDPQMLESAISEIFIDRDIAALVQKFGVIRFAEQLGVI